MLFKQRLVCKYVNTNASSYTSLILSVIDKFMLCLVIAIGTIKSINYGNSLKQI